MPRGRPRGRIRATSRMTRSYLPFLQLSSVSDKHLGNHSPNREIEMSDGEPADGSNPRSPPEDDQVDTQAENADESEAAEEQSEHSEPPQPIVRKRRLGRPPKNRLPGWDTPRRDDDRSDGGTPVRRKRGRPAGGGFRGRPRYAKHIIEKVRIDKEGTMMDVVGDEVALPEDPEGEEKVDKMGNLLGGRDYRVRVFTVKNRGDRLYMLSTEPARCCGFRDSYLFFTKHLKLHKVIVEDDEKMDLIARDIIPHSYKGRSIGVVTARSVFREFGARIIIGGKKVIDDYYAQDARNRGEAEGELADPNDRLPPPGQEYNKNQYVAWHGASAVYHQSGPAVVPGQIAPGKRKIAITSANWQLEHARAASNFNSVILANRRANLDGIYDIHTNTVHYPKIMQPTHAKWEELPYVEASSSAQVINSDADGVTNLTNGVENVSLDSQPSEKSTTMFFDVPKVVSRNFLVTDTTYETPPFAGLGIPGPDGDSRDVGPNGLPDIDEETLALLPPECRTALVEAKKKEAEWKTNWSSEKDDGARGHLEIRYAFPTNPGDSIPPTHSIATILEHILTLIVS